MRLLTALFISFALFGCSNAPAVLASATGAVRLDGLPLKEGVIIFEGDDAPPAYGKIVDGQIVEVTTHQPNDGMSLGPKLVAVRPNEGHAVLPGAVQPAVQSTRFNNQVLPNRYRDPSTSNLSCRIVDGPNNLLFSLASEHKSPFPAEQR